MRKNAFFLTLLFILLSACSRQSNVCAGEPANQPIEIRQQLDLESYQPELEGFLIRVRNKETRVDQIVHGYVCDADWSGSVYVDCDVQVNEWEEKPNFFEGCDLNIDPDTVVYVAYHNDEAYFKGCSCHFNDVEKP